VRVPERVEKSEEEWRRELTPERYAVCREGGTERAFTGEYWSCKDPGVYRCAACGLELFGSEAKYDSGTGWPSFSAPVDARNVRTEVDRSLGTVRTEVLCAACDSHLGHVFDDGPEPTGQRYCMNSLSLELERK
jgi:peptide-methionine (R)-S-oxide reductase